MCQACRRLRLCMSQPGLVDLAGGFYRRPDSDRCLCLSAEGQGDGFQLCRVTAADALEWACFANSWEVSGWGQVTGDLQDSGNTSPHSPHPRPRSQPPWLCSVGWRVWRRQATWQALSGHSHVGPGRREEQMQILWESTVQSQSAAFPP